MSDSRSGSCRQGRRGGGKGPGILLALLGILAVGLAMPETALAASVFMKNGYIIQGPVVERDETKVVLGWPNGRVFLARRFIEGINFDPGEEKRLEEEERLQRQAAEAAGSVTDYILSANETPELPSTLEELVRTYNLQTPTSGTTTDVAVEPPPSDGRPGSDGSPDVVTSGPGGDTTVPTTTLLSRPGEELGDEVEDEDRGISVRPPKGWTVDSSDEAFGVVGPSDSTGFRPSFNVVRLDRGTLSGEDYLRLLKEETQRLLEGYELVQESPRELGGKKAYELLANGSYQGQNAVMRQILVTDEEDLWLISVFTEDRDSTTGTFALTDESLKTLEFLTP